jgi:hypothetical protein
MLVNALPRAGMEVITMAAKKKVAKKTAKKTTKK